MEEAYKSTYKTARSIAEVISFIGWFIFAVCVLGAIVTGFKMGKEEAPALMRFLAILPWIGGMIGGILNVGIGQLIRTNVDTADNTGEMLAIMKQRQWQG